MTRADSHHLESEGDFVHINAAATTASRQLEIIFFDLPLGPLKRNKYSFAGIKLTKFWWTLVHATELVD